VHADPLGVAGTVTLGSDHPIGLMKQDSFVCDDLVEGDRYEGASG
jgi:hypothetical protein